MKDGEALELFERFQRVFLLSDVNGKNFIHHAALNQKNVSALEFLLDKNINDEKAEDILGNTGSLKFYWSSFFTSLSISFPDICSKINECLIIKHG